MPPVIEMQGITKRFPGVTANDNVDFSLAPAEIHALLGENGSGKTTLMNVLYGLIRPDRGRIYLRGRSVAISKPSAAIKLGIGMVHQHFMLAPLMTVAENMIVGLETTRLGLWLDLNQAAHKVRELSSRYNLAVDPEARVADLPLGIRQRVEILKALYREADVLILDEPTAVLTPGESDNLFLTMGKLKEMGKSIVFITHKLKEVIKTADRITVLRGGRSVGTLLPQETNEKELAELMVGREVALGFQKKHAPLKETILEAVELTARDDRGRQVLDNVSFKVRSGEIFVLAGIQGNGQTELIEVLTGLRPLISGRVEVCGRDLTNQPPGRIYDQGVSHVPEDRHRYGMVEEFSIADNLILNNYGRPPFTRGWTYKRPAVLENAERLMAEYDIRAPAVSTPAASLSGGNQQKMVVAREFSRSTKLLIAAQPTRGLDVGSIEFIHRRIVAKRDEGCAVLLASTELDEILTLADRIAVMYQGRIVAVLDASEASRTKVGLLMAGGTSVVAGNNSAEATVVG